MSEKKRKLLTICAVVGLIVAVNGTAEANWFEDFNDMTFNLTWLFRAYPELTGTFSATIQDGPGDDDYVSLDETSPAAGGGSQFGVGIGDTDDIFSDVRVGAVFNVTGDVSRNYHGLAARITYFIVPPGGTPPPYPGIIASCYVMTIHYEDGPENLRIELVKAVNLSDEIMETFQPEVPVPGIDHDRSRYVELDVVGSDPVYITGSIYEYKGGPLLARTPTFIDTSANDPWEKPGIHDDVFASGVSGIFGMYREPQPDGYHTTFDTVSSVSDGPAAVCLSPPDGATDVSIDANLIWVEADFATSRELWFGKEGAMEKVVPAPDSNTYDPGPLNYGQTYQWRVDEVNDTSGTTVEGHVWTFTTLDSLLVDDMEAYTGRQSIRAVWRDGYLGEVEVATSGSNVTVSTESDDRDPRLAGDGPPWPVRDSEAMQFAYDNDGSITIYVQPYALLTYSADANYYSEIEASTSGPNSLEVDPNWTEGGVKALTLWFYGDADNDIEPMWVKLTDQGGSSGKVTYGDYGENPNDINDPSWHEWNIALSDFGVDLTHVNDISIGFGDENNKTVPGGSGVVFFDDIRLYPTRCLLSLRSPDFARVDYVEDCVIDYKEVAVMAANWLVEAAAPSDANLVAWYEFEGDANDSSGNGHHGVANGSPSYTGGKIGQAINLDGVGDYVETDANASDLGIGGGNPKTTCAWVYTRAFSNGGIWESGLNSDGKHWCLRTLDNIDNRWRAQLHGGDFDFDVTYPSKNKWVHFALVYDGTAAGNEYRLYADGDLIGSKTNALDTVDDITFRIGRYGDNYFDGLVDDVRIYNVVLTDVEILGLASLRTDLYEDQKINFKDFAVLADMWLDEQLYP